ncbi:sulfurtransferase complex subunit TusB [Bowmanella sp. Y26]|uniref:Sulfurtransferase complex subunit TusB n=1 Tax=Bowmanella yangjiangensis TaxID=2811230 RepID=A0ABS3CW14_9ALTE|nr:sulfurtransferase complex subunit TusB [Bowmanella yangjiangensis]MBN7820601.1 sulfurtransferase complex subunit TusB [Bowmanella yangjiangensis]MBT1063806.1 sulfurtransferase complex subunit TusB [Bowmanella yangjiangensis]
MILHLLRSSPFSDHSLSQCLSRIAKQDGIVLIQDAVYALQGHQQAWYSLLMQCEQLYVLQDDLYARGIKAADAICTIDYPQLVALTLKFDKVMSW